MTKASPRLVAVVVALSFLPAGFGRAQSVTLLNTNLDSALPGAYSNGSIINSSGSATAQLTVAQATPQGVVVTGTSSDLSLEFIDNSMSSASCYVKRAFTALSTTGTGSNAITGRFSVTPLGGSSGSNPTLELLINAGSDGAGSTVTAVQLDIRGSGVVSYKTASSTVTGPTLTVGTKYTVSLYVDLSSATQDTWNLTITNAATGAVVYAVTNLATRAANIAPDRIVFNGGVSTTDANASSFVRIDDFDFSAAPAVPPPDPGTPLLITNLDSATLGAYVNGAIINSSGSAITQLTVAQATPQIVQVVSATGGDQALQFIDSSTGTPNCYVKKSFTALSTTGTGNNLLTGSFSVVPLGGSTGSNPTFQFLVNSGFDTAGSTVTAIQFEFRGSGGTSYKTASSTVTGPTLTVGTKYNVSISLDLSSGTQDTWGYVIARADSGTVVSSASGLATRAANVAPDRLVFNGGVNTADASAFPFIQIDDLRFSANTSSGTSQIVWRMGGGDMVNGDTTTPTVEKFQTLQILGANLCRMGLYPTYYWNFSGSTPNTPRTEAVEQQMLLAHNQGIVPMLIFQHYGSYQASFPLGDYNKWYQIGQAFATKYSPNSTWLVSQGITNWGVTQFYAINEPDGSGAANTPAIPITGTSSYYEALRGLADGVHAVNSTLKVFPGGFARPNSANDWTCGGYATAIAPLLNNGTLDGLTIHTYYDSTASTGTAIAYAPMDGTYTNSCQYTFEQVKAACGITRDINFYCDEYNYRRGNDTEANSAVYFLTALWDAVGVTGNSGTVVSQCAIPWNLFNLAASDPNYGMATQSGPWQGTARGQVFQLVCSLASGMDIVSANPKTTGEYQLTGSNKTMWVWQNRAQWTNHAGTTYTVPNIPTAATSLKVYNATGLIQTIALTGQTSYQVTGLTSGQTYMFVANSQ